MDRNKHISILGSTGSIGTQTLSLIRENTDIRVDALTCNKNIGLFEKQIREFKPKLVCVSDEKAALDLKVKIADTDTKVLSGMEGLIEAAVYKTSDMVVGALVGMIGIEPSVAAIKAQKTLALANKETLVCAGDSIMALAKEKGVSIIPVDSEHSAIFQSLQGRQNNEIKNILLTASGGPFFGKTKEQLKDVTKKQALAHPNWSMGAKITIDCATMVNKGLEIIEACHLFGISHEKIKVLIHRQSILHSAVEYRDGGIIGQMGVPDMRLPIAYALFYPERRPISENALSLTKVGSLTFEEADTDTFFGPALARKAIEMRGNMPAIFNAANEIAVARFLNDQIGFLDIQKIIERAMSEVPFIKDPSLSDILKILPDMQGSY